MKVKTRVIAVLTAVVAVSKARCQSTGTTECFRRSVHCRSGWSVAMNNDRSYRRHWFYSIDHSRGQRSIRYRFVSFSRIKKLLGRTETRNRDRMYLGRIRSVRDISRDDRARIAACSWLLHTLQTHRLRTNSLITFSSREGINSRCRRFDRSCHRSCCRRSDGPLAINRDYSMLSPLTALSSLPFRLVGGDEP